MKGTYPAVLTPLKEGGYLAKVPDISGCITSGIDIDDTVSNLEDALSGCLIVLGQFGIYPPASKPENISLYENDILIQVNYDTAE